MTNIIIWVLTSPPPRMCCLIIDRYSVADLRHQNSSQSHSNRKATIKAPLMLIGAMKGREHEA